jgi:hypothetical protein
MYRWKRSSSTGDAESLRQTSVSRPWMVLDSGTRRAWMSYWTTGAFAGSCPAADTAAAARRKRTKTMETLEAREALGVMAMTALLADRLVSI